VTRRQRDKDTIRQKGQHNKERAKPRNRARDKKERENPRKRENEKGKKIEKQNVKNVKKRHLKTKRKGEKLIKIFIYLLGKHRSIRLKFSIGLMLKCFGINLNRLFSHIKVVRIP
jgi:hypothetical protein